MTPFHFIDKLFVNDTRQRRRYNGRLIGIIRDLSNAAITNDLEGHCSSWKLFYFQYLEKYSTCLLEYVRRRLESRMWPIIFDGLNQTGGLLKVTCTRQ